MRKVRIAIGTAMLIATASLMGPLSARSQSAGLEAPQFAAPNLGAKGVMGLAMNCAICHGPEGRPAAGSSVPPLAGRGEAQTVEAMRQFKEGSRPASVMHQIAKGYSDAEIEALARYFAGERR